MIVAESWGEQERKQKQPLVGVSGQFFNKILTANGIDRKDCFLTNVVPERPQGNKMCRFFYTREDVKKGYAGINVRGLHPKDNVLQGLNNLATQIAEVKPDIIIALGNYALWALTEDSFGIGKDTELTFYDVPTGITRWRGSQLVTRPDMGSVNLLPTYHPAGALRQFSWTYDIRHDIGMRVPKALQLPPGENWCAPDWDFLVGPSYDEVIAKLEWLLLRAGEAEKAGTRIDLAADIETFAGHITCLGLAWSKLEAMCIPFTSDSNPEGYWTFDQEVEIIKLTRRLLRHKGVAVIGQNYLYDAQFMALYWGFIPRIDYDTMAMQHICWPGKTKGLDYLSSMYCRYHVYWKDEGKERAKGGSERQHWIYNCKDCVATLEVKEELLSLIEQLGLQEQWQHHHDQIEMILEMEIRGVLRDQARNAEMSFQLMEAATEREIRLRKMMPECVYPIELTPTGRVKKKAPWYKSDAQLKHILYDLLGVKIVYNRKTKRPTVNAEAIGVIKRREPLLIPMLTLIEELRSIGVFHNTFIKALTDPDDRLRSEYDPTGAETYRWASRKNPWHRGANLQNIPQGTEDNFDD